MKYAHEVIDLMGAYPGREFRMAEIIRHVCRGRRLSARETEAVRKAVRRVLAALEENGQVWRQADSDKSALYAWGVAHLDARTSSPDRNRKLGSQKLSESVSLRCDYGPLNFPR